MMERKPIRAWRRIQQKRVWRNRLRNLYYYAGFNTNGSPNEKKEYESWKDLKNASWCHIYKNTGRPCNCCFCKAERYNRLDYKKESLRIIEDAFLD